MTWELLFKVCLAISTTPLAEVGGQNVDRFLAFTPVLTGQAYLER